MNGLIINQNTNKYSENLFSTKSVFDGSITLNKTGGTSLATITYSEDYIYKTGKSIKSYITDTNILAPVFNEFNLGDALSFVCPKNGNYVFSFNGLATFSPSVDSVEKIVVTKFVNTLPEDIEFIYESNNANLSTEKWYTFSQSFDLVAGDVVDFSFKHFKELSGAIPTSTLYLDGFKIELSDRFNGIPTPYSLPINYCCNDLNRTTGWASYTDTVFTSGSPFTIASGVTSTLPCNGGSKIETQLPNGYDMLFNSATNKLKAFNVDDKYLLNVRFKAKTSVTNDFLTIGVDIGGTQNIIVSEDVLFTRGANTEQTFNIILTYFTRATFIANGGLIKITAKNGNIQIYDILVIPELTHKAI